MLCRHDVQVSISPYGGFSRAWTVVGLIFVGTLKTLNTLKTLKTKRPRDLDTQSQKVHVFKNIKNKFPENDPLFLMFLNI